MSDKNRDEEEFAFIKEKIKNKPLDKRRLAIHTVLVIFLAALFGFVACFVFTAVMPYMDGWVNGKSTVEIPMDEQDVTESDDSNDGMEDGSGTDQNGEAASEGDTGTPSGDGQSGEADLGVTGDGTGDGLDAADSQASEDEVPEPQVIYQKEELEIEDYQELQNMIFDVGKEASKSIVTVTGLTSVTDWFDTSYESTSQASGIIIAQTGSELLILTEKKVITDVQEIRITFINDDTVAAELKKYDGNTGIAVLSVPVAELSEATKNAIATATLGNSLSCSQGQVVIAIGSPLGSNFSILTGNITSASNSISTLDSTYSVFTTDIIGSSGGSGALVNLEGAIIGLVMQDYSNSEDEGTLTAISISELKENIEKLSNGQDIPYLGLKVSTVTAAIAKDYEIPKGVYVKSVADESPAMIGGIQNGDVIVSMNETDIVTIADYEKVLQEQTPGAVLNITVKRQGNNGYIDIPCVATVGVLQ